MTPLSASADGWERYRLADGRLPDAIAAGQGFRGEVQLVLDGRQREVRLLIPPAASTPAPLLVALHGRNQTMKSSQAMMRWEPVAQQHGAVLAYASGSSASWAAGTCCGRAAEDGVDDVAYLDKVLEIAGALHPLERRRLHLAGFSSGAMMAYRYACERPDRVASVLAVSGTLTTDCPGGRDVAVLAVHGALDRTVPLQGSAYSPVMGSPLRPVSFVSTAFGPRVRLVVLPGHGHGWPTRERGGYDATGQGWAFLSASPKPG